MIEQLGPLGIFGFTLLSFVGLAIGYRLGRPSNREVLCEEDGTAQILAHSAMVMALALNSEAIHSFWVSLMEALPQSGSEINEITATVVVGLTLLFWVIAPILIAIVRSEISDFRMRRDANLQ